MLFGYMGKILFVDLSDKKLEDESLDERFCREYIGSYGMGARLLFDRQKSGIDPLGPDNGFGIFTGPLTGTSALSGVRYTIFGKSPLTGTWGDANSGGYFGPTMKFAGYDGIVFTGISSKPVYLLIKDGEAELKEAIHLWGKDTYETEDILKTEYGDKAQVACIGPSGEKLSLISCVMNERGRAAGRSGLGAVMGSKKLKAVVVKGDLKVPVANEKTLKEIRQKYKDKLCGPYDVFRKFGTPGSTVMHIREGDTPVKNWSGTANDFPGIDNFEVENLIERLSKKYACHRCPIACGGLIKEGTGKYKYAAGSHRPEYETLAMFGSNCLNDNLESIIKLNDICNRYGVDTISAGATIAFTIECYEKGLISKSDTDGIEMTWGNHEAIVQMTEKLVKRDGFGRLLADGAKIAADRIGKGAEKYAIHIKGQEIAAHDPKLRFGAATSYRMDPTPARHTQGTEDGRHPAGIIPEYDPKAFTGRAAAHKKGSNFWHIVNSSGICAFMYSCLPSVDVLGELLAAVTGWDVTTEELLKTGERIANVRQAFNIREGLNPLQFEVPDRLIGKPPKKEGGTAGITVDEETLDKEYLNAMDWDEKTAKPKKKKLQELGLEDIAQQIWA